jgi:hypothetical protein
LERAQTFQEKSSRRKRLLIGAAALAVEEISVESAGRSQGACGQRPEPTGHHLDFLLIQITSSLADQHSVLVIHAYLLSSFLGPLERAQSSSRKFPGSAERCRTRLAAELTDVLVSIRRRKGGADWKSNKAPIDEVGFRGRQLASATANQNSVLVIHAYFLLLFLGRLRRPILQKSCRSEKAACFNG